MKKKTTYLMLVLLCFSLVSCAQKREITFNLNWKVGEKKMVSSKSIGKVVKNNKPIQDTLIIQKAEINVISENDSAYFVDYKVENELVKFGSTFYKNLETEMAGESILTMKYRIGKTSLSAVLMNVPQVDSIIQKDNDVILSILEKKVPEKKLLFTDQFDAFFKKFKMELEPASDEFFSSILYLNNKKFVRGDTLKYTDTLVNPLKLQNFNGAKVKAFISKVDKGNNMVDVTVNKNYDFEAHKALLTEMTNKVMPDSNQTNNLSKKILAPLGEMMTTLLKSLQIEYFDNMIITQQQDSSWPSKVSQRLDMKVKDATGDTSINAIKTIEIK